MTKYFCDHCKKEVKTLEELRQRNPYPQVYIASCSDCDIKLRDLLIAFTTKKGKN